MNHSSQTTLCLAGIALAIVVFSIKPGDICAANWSVTLQNDVTLNTSSVSFAVEEMSGVTYLGSSPTAGMHRFAVVQDSSQDVIFVDASFTLTGSLLSAEAIGRVTLDEQLDFEGVTQAGNSLFISEEDGPGVHEFSLSTGNKLQSVSIPAVFTNNKRANKGFESLTRSTAGTKMWTANEEALTVDGPASSTSQGTIVRIMEFDVTGNVISPSGQFAYEVEPIHTTTGIIQNFRGLSELVALPDGRLLALERSLAGFASPTLLASIYEVDFIGATDVSQPPFDAGLDGQTFTLVGKEQLWSGTVGAGSGENLEGLALGPRLPNGNWVMLGVVDNGGFFSNNTVASFELAPTTPLAPDPSTADFNQDGNANGLDFLSWQRGFGVGSLAGLAHGDGNHDGAVDVDDLAIWQTGYGQPVVASAAIQTVPEPTCVSLLLLGTLGFNQLCRRSIRNRITADFENAWLC